MNVIFLRLDFQTQIPVRWAQAQMLLDFLAGVSRSHYVSSRGKSKPVYGPLIISPAGEAQLPTAAVVYCCLFFAPARLHHP